jgi:hypothetical protein
MKFTIELTHFPNGDKVLSIEDRKYFNPTPASITRVIRWAISHWLSKSRGETGLWYLVQR